MAKANAEKILRDKIKKMIIFSLIQVTIAKLNTAGFFIFLQK